MVKKMSFLKREDFIRVVDSNKIWSKSLSLIEIKSLLESLENEIIKYEFRTDMNFLMDERRYGLKTMIEERLSSNEENKIENILESLFNFWEFVNNEYYVASSSASHRLNMDRSEIESKCMAYTKSGVICAQEKDIILEMILYIKNSI